MEEKEECKDIHMFVCVDRILDGDSNWVYIYECSVCGKIEEDDA